MKKWIYKKGRVNRKSKNGYDKWNNEMDKKCRVNRSNDRR